MSWWTYKKDKDGNFCVTSNDVITAFTFLVFLSAPLFAFLYFINPSGIARLLLWVGFFCLLTAKVSLFRQGVWNSWGPGQMTKWWSRIYKLGYVLIGLGAVVTLALYRAVP
jgi:hypothetical protein